MKNMLKTALASTLAVCLTCSAAVFGGSAAEPEQTVETIVDTDTAYAKTIENRIQKMKNIENRKGTQKATVL